MQVSERQYLTARTSQHRDELQRRETEHTPARIEGLLVADTNRLRGVAPGAFEDPAIFLGEGEGAVRAG